ncbi:MAG: 50S ribosomal protein L5 [Clostridiales bacterium]|nr:50S ribosomal protein L5 [Clostridiales bacterium]
MLNLKDRYEQVVVPEMQKKFGYRNPMEVPRIEKVVINMGVGDAVQNPKLLDAAVEELTAIAGQRAAVTRAKKSVASFKVRAGMPIGARVTLRRQRMWDFLTKLFYLALPRVRDFRGLDPESFDGRGNYTLGLKEQVVFPEVDYDKVEKIRGMDITIVTTAKTDEEARELLRLLGAPWAR